MAAALQHGASSWHCDGEDVAPWGKDGGGGGGERGGLLIWADTATTVVAHISVRRPLVRSLACLQQPLVLKVRAAFQHMETAPPKPPSPSPYMLTNFPLV